MKDIFAKYGISSPYGPRGGGFHAGVDSPCPTGTPLYAPAAGTVRFEGPILAAAPGYPDDIIVILQLTSTFLVFAHLSETVVNTGQSVKQGQLLGYTGNSGYSTGPHLHAEERIGTTATQNNFWNYQSVSITPRTKGQVSGGNQDMTIIVKPISKLKTTLVKPIQMYDFQNGKALWNSGTYMELTQKALVNGGAYYVPEDRAKDGHLYGFKESDVFAKGNKVHDTQHDPKPVTVDPATEKKVDQLLRQTEAMTITIDKLEVANQKLTEKLDTADKLVNTLIAENKEQTDAIAVQTTEIRKLKEANATLKDAAINNDALAALSGGDLVRLGIRRWLGIDDSKEVKT